MQLKSLKFAFVASCTCCMITGSLSSPGLSKVERFPIDDNMKAQSTSPLHVSLSSPSVPVLKLGEHEDLFKAKSRLLQVSGSPTEDHHDDEDHHEHHEEEGNPKPWLEVIGATLLVNVSTITGVVFLTFLRKNQDKNKQPGSFNWMDVIIPGFAGGALLATGVFLTIPEAISLIQTSVMKAIEEEEGHIGNNHRLRFLEGEEGHGGHSEEHGTEILPSVIWRFGTAVLAGFLFPVIFACLFPRTFTNKDTQEDQSKAVNKMMDEEGQMNGKKS
jgi:hypothetical protein